MALNPSFKSAETPAPSGHTKRPIRQELVSHRDQRREEKLERYFENRHKTAVAGLELEKFIAELPEPKTPHELTATKHLVNESLKYKLPHLDLYVRETLAEHLRDYLNTFYKVVQWEQSSKKGAQSFKEKWDGGVSLYTQILKAYPPKGNIKYHREGGLITLTCESSEDYASFATGKINAVETSIGCYRTMVEVMLYTDRGNTKTIIPIAFAKGNTTDENVYEHERQHFINDQVYKLFKNLEPKKADERVAEVDPYQHIKDEVLARVRGGQSVKAVLSAYDRLFESFKPNDDNVRQLIGEIDELLITNVLWSRNRPLLVNHLLDVPLEKMPVWLKRLDVYYRKRVKEAHKYQDMAQDICEQAGYRAIMSIVSESDEKYPDNLPGRDDYSKVTRELLVKTSRASRAAYNGNLKEPLEQSAEAFEKWKRSFNKLTAEIKRWQKKQDQLNREHFFSENLERRKIELDWLLPEVKRALPPEAQFAPPYDKLAKELHGLLASWKHALAQARIAADPPKDKENALQDYEDKFEAVNRVVEAYWKAFDKLHKGTVFAPYMVPEYDPRRGRRDTTFDAFHEQTQRKLLSAMGSLNQNEINEWYGALADEDKKKTAKVRESMAKVISSRMGRQYADLKVYECDVDGQGIKAVLSFSMKNNAFSQNQDVDQYVLHLSPTDKARALAEEKRGNPSAAA